MASFSKNSIYRFATIGETGLPIAVPNFCLYMSPLNVKYVVVKINAISPIMSCTLSLVLFFKVLSFSNRSRITERASSIGVFVNNDATSCDAKLHPPQSSPCSENLKSALSS